MFVWKQSGCVVVYYDSNVIMVVNDMFVSDCMKPSVQYHLIHDFYIKYRGNDITKSYKRLLILFSFSYDITNDNKLDR